MGEDPPRLAPGNRRANGTSGSVGLPTSSNADSLTDNGLPVRKLEKLGAASASDDISGADLYWRR